MFSWSLIGGRSRPSHCCPRHSVAIIVPYRNRDEQLRTFLYNIHPILQRQLDYGIYVVEQGEHTKFNRAMLMNIGFVKALELDDYHCFVFHDVDLIPENDRNMYTCSKHPRHLSVAIDFFNYSLPYKTIYGGVCTMTREHFQKVNGFPNRYFGWGGEDDDTWLRWKMLEKSKDYFNIDGLNSLKYKVMEEDTTSLFTRFVVELNQIEIMQKLQKRLTQT
ncbi:Beta-1,4-N-acetylgalactosaminyltransferase bre-4,Beta-N-acetyl-D-glucosaminide beta-1,4-N-acetylglucosaminyl-transferase,Beta-1,4-galactosyltransferase 1,Beta-1,4-galactosyltransferase 2,Beta-1,4-galactosyltransferase 3,Beta-1,4-galactosyltransferase 6,Beta-1,4-galactosyltransferase 5,Beta-1,4-galactosyltransferase 4 [Mytilus coruscus]|uniref:Beta-1,4-N-acetylgalactosaminyltransferase bre-4 n=1 Tax=Mytilus coruscus TaxID=42192 RepID=A0A6J8DQC2_MYTCO|nr:Beta-1,4-N-acetylgalactosaminyltransferase bre-4,Beta-N-acetyl-D-glucosaminide beta-1,4-N-acetylglucosaminyl-transferase,Beta-1,4-galactosyltransferase 1,Beta-1,4-galactosyltransferase 2,Beta-1,4-galactosyltransferase 3,Beta-1,4-galactosyltransferase 6,Beta-1,4-galactosyltransferase 5,Beta-1,4-galactosyltransferase 4 [Mytilus coruscus]